jgi:hypothetical protein
MLPTNVDISLNKIEKFLGLCLGVAPNFSKGGTLPFVLLGLVRAIGKFEAASNELDGTHNNMMVWKHFRRMKDWLGSHCLRFVRELSDMGLSRTPHATYPRQSLLNLTPVNIG